MATQTRPPDPRQIRVLVVDNKQASRAATLRLLHDCSYQAAAVQTGNEAVQLLQAQVHATGEPGFDLILKEHEPPASNAARFLKRLQADANLKTLPIVVVSSYDARDVVLKCLSLGASDYWIKPLRANEVRNLWTRVWWRKVASGALDPASLGDLISSDEASEETKNAEEQEPTSKEGSAPDGAQNLTPGHASGNGSSGVQGGRLVPEGCGGPLLNAPDGSGSGNNGEKGQHGSGQHGSNTGPGSGDATGHRSNGGLANGGSGQLGSGNDASAVANGHTSNDGNGNNVGCWPIGNGGSNGNGGGNHVGSNFGNGNGAGGSNGNGGGMPYDASTNAKPGGLPHHHHLHAHHAHLHGHHGGGHHSARHHHSAQGAQQAQQGAAAAAAAAAAGVQQFQSPPPRPRVPGVPPDVRPPFAAVSPVERYLSGLTTNANANGSSNAQGVSSAPPAAIGTAEGKEERSPTGFTAWATLHGRSEPGQAASPNEVMNEVAEVAEALTSLRDSGGSPGGSQVARGGAEAGSGGRQTRASAAAAAAAAAAQQQEQQQQQRGGGAAHLVKPMPIKFSRTTVSDDTRLPHARGAATSAPAPAPENTRDPGGSAPPTLVTWSDPGRALPMGAGAQGVMSAQFPRGPAQMPPPLVAQQLHTQHAQHAVHHSALGASASGSMLQQQQGMMQAQQQAPTPHGGMFGPFPPTPYGHLPPFMPPPLGFPWGGTGMPGQLGMGAPAAPPYQFPFGGTPPAFMPQGASREMMAVQQMMSQQQYHQQQYILPYHGAGMAPPFPAQPWVRPPGPAWGQQAQQMPPPAMLAANATAGPATTQLMMPAPSHLTMARNPAHGPAGAFPGMVGPMGPPMQPQAAAAAAAAAGVGAGVGVGSSLPGPATAMEEGKSGLGTTEAQSKREARQQALNKYKEKRKNLNASNKIRYQARKALAEQRPRVKGQFVKVSKDGLAAAEAQQQGSNGGALTTAASPNATCCEEGQGGAERAQPILREGGGGAGAGNGVVNMERDQGEYEDEGLEYDQQEEDLGEEGEDEMEEGAGRSRAGTGGGAGGRGGAGLQRMAIDAPAGHGGARCTLQADESESATQSITDPHQHAHTHHGAGPIGIPAGGPPNGGASLGGAGAGAGPMDAGGGREGAASPQPPLHTAMHHKLPLLGHITGQKHKRDSANRNGSDSGSNSPGYQTPSGMGGGGAQQV